MTIYVNSASTAGGADTNNQVVALPNMDTTLRLEFTGTFSARGKGIKRKRLSGSVTDSDDAFSLELGLGHSASSSNNSKVSCSTAFASLYGREIDEETSANLLQLSLGGDISLKRPAMATPKLLDPEIDLQLSLSSVLPSSITKNAQLRPVKHQEVSVTAYTVPTVDDKSTLSFRNTNAPSMLCFSDAPAVNNFSLAPKMDEEFLPNPKISNSMLASSSVTSTSGITHKSNVRIANPKTCQFQGCSKGARGASGLCIAHGGGRRCQREGCHKGAEGRTIYCKAHGGGRRCQFLGCTKSAEGRTEFCIAHGGGRRCTHDGCTRAARGKSGLCIRHGGGKRCQKENCTKSAEGYSGFCISHGGGRRCQFPSCTKGAQGSTNFCKAHGGGKRCTAEGCTKGAEGSTPFCKGHGGGKRCSFEGCRKSVHGGTKFCVAHGGGKRCAVPDCNKSARGRTNFCVRHGGGKRCKSIGCSKSAQGRTDFCKAHGGGNRCTWGQPGSRHGIGELPCDRFAKAKSGLCSLHGTIVQDNRVHGAGSLRHDRSKDAQVSNLHNMEVAVSAGDLLENLRQTRPGYVECFIQQAGPQQSIVPSLPEGRVHGGNLLSMLANGANLALPTGKVLSEAAHVTHCD